MKTSIKPLLKSHGPCLTSELISHMVANGVSPSAARQRITRSQWDYKKLAGLRFAKNARFIYLDEQYGDQKFWNAIERAFKLNGKSYWGAITGLAAKGGRCPKYLFPNICGAPLNRKGQLSPDLILERLCAINMLEERNDGDQEDSYISFKPFYYPVSNSAESKAIFLAEFAALHAIKDWARKLGLGSYDKFKIRGSDDPPLVSGIAWDITAPSYIRPLVSARDGKLKPGFFVCDINLASTIDDDQVELFIRKYDMAASLTNVSPIVAFLVGDFTSSAFDKAKSAGIIATTISNLFGSEISKALKDLIKLLSDTGATASINPKHLEKVMAQLTKIEGAASNLRASLFELVVGGLAKDVMDGFLRTGVEKVHRPSGRKMEIDVLLDKNEEKKSIVIECKAKIPGSQVGLDDVQKWHSDRAPLIYETLKQESHYLDKEICFELWTNGTFHPSALSWFESQEKKSSADKLSLVDGSKLKEYASKAKNKTIRKILDDHYFRNPFTKVKT